MSGDKKQFSLKKYQEKRSGRISVLGMSAEFDWFFIVFITLMLLVVVFAFSIIEIREVLDFEPEADTSIENLIRDKGVIKDLDNVIEKFSEKNSSEVID